MGSLNGRVRRLAEKHLAPATEDEGRRYRLEAKRAEIIASLQRVMEEEGVNPDDPSHRRRALEDLQEFIEMRKSGA
jgi:hypothetical protein